MARYWIQLVWKREGKDKVQRITQISKSYAFTHNDTLINMSLFYWFNSSLRGNYFVKFRQCRRCKWQSSDSIIFLKFPISWALHFMTYKWKYSNLSMHQHLIGGPCHRITSWLRIKWCIPFISWTSGNSSLLNCSNKTKCCPSKYYSALT